MASPILNGSRIESFNHRFFILKTGPEDGGADPVFGLLDNFLMVLGFFLDGFRVVELVELGLKLGGEASPSLSGW